MSPSGQLRAGVAGAGYWGINLVRTCAKLGVLAAVCDPDVRPLEAIRSQYDGVRVFTNYDAMLEEAQLDAVILASPAQHHAKMALAAVAAGKDVFVEKPLALNVSDAERVVEAAANAGRKLFVGHVLLYHPAVRTMFELIREGRIGDVRHVRSRRLSWGRLRAHEDVWWSFAPHDVAVMLELFGEDPAGCTFSTGAYVRPHIADLTYADFTFSMGRTAHIEVAWIDPDKTSRIDVFGSRGVLSFSDARAGARLVLTPGGDRLNARGEPELVREDAVELGVPAGEPLACELEAFFAYARDGQRPITHGEEGLAVVRTLARLHDYPATMETCV